MKSYRVTIEGISPLLMNRFHEQAEESIKKSVRRAKINSELPRQEAEKKVYRMEDGRLYAPATWFMKSFINAAGYHKQRGLRKSMRYVAPAAFLVCPEAIIFDGNLRNYEVDSRPGNNPYTKGKVMIHRPRLDSWRLTFEAQIDEEIIDPQDSYQILADAGKKVGVGDFRVEKGGPFGRFHIILWEETRKRRDG